MTPPANALTLHDKFLNIIPDSLKETGFLVQHWQWLGILLFATVGIIIDKIVTLIYKKILHRWSQRTKKDFTENDLEWVARPAGLIAMSLFWWLAIDWLQLPAAGQKIAIVTITIFGAFACIWVAYRLVDVMASLMSKAAEKTPSRMDDIVVTMVRKSLKVFVIIIGVLFVAENAGFDMTAVLAGLGIGGVAFALAAKDTVENVFGSLTVLFDKPFEIGDWVTIGNVEGTVEEVGFRSTRIRTAYNSLVTIPNSNLIKTPVDNLGPRKKKRRVKTTLGVKYSTSLNQIEAFCEGIREIIRDHPQAKPGAQRVYLNDFGTSALNIILDFFLQVPNLASELRERERIFKNIIRLADELKVEFAFPTQTIHIDSQANPSPMPKQMTTKIDEMKNVQEARALGAAIGKKIASENPIETDKT